VSGPAQAEVLAKYFETAGVPFHAWAVVHGIDPAKESRMAADVLSAGARSIFLDIEPHAGFWRGTPADAETYGRELRRLQPNGKVVLSIDPRPWMLDRLPMKQFLGFSDEIAPQQYWRTFNTQANYDRFNQMGFRVGPEGVTPEFLADVQKQVIAPMGVKIAPVGQGATPDSSEWKRFIDRAFADGAMTVSAWRYGVTPPEVLGIMRDMPPPLPPAPQVSVYVVQPGDSLGAIAAQQGVSVDEIMRLNGLTDPNYLVVGQELKLSANATAAAVAAPAPAPAADVEVHAASASNANGTRSYTVVEGDTLSALAGRFGSTVDGIVKASSLASPDALSIGQQLVIP
jgi:LysM repeat protein